MAHHTNGTKANDHYSQFLPDLTLPRFTSMSKQDADTYAADFKKNGQPPWLYALWRHWRELFNKPFKGVTSDGTVRRGLFGLQDEGMPIEAIVEDTNKLLSLLNDEQKATLSYHIDSPEWRSWSNPEFLLSDKGLRLENQTPEIISSIMSILRATLSPEGYIKAISAMRINHFLGEQLKGIDSNIIISHTPCSHILVELVRAPRICNEHSYNLVLFGVPSTTRPWGISFYGHHLCLNIFLYKTQTILSPWFTGVEPNQIDAGPWAGTRILHREEALGLQLMQSLSPSLQRSATSYSLMHDPAMPPGRWNRDDQRHLCGAFRDNRVVPYEGIPASTLSPSQLSLLWAILSEFLLYLPSRVRSARLAQIQACVSETHFCWIGGHGDDDPFYYRIQSPVIIVEFDHHSGVFLNNVDPAKFHVHTLLRTPNGGDYGKALRPLIPAVEQAWVWEEDLKREK